jgi:hypothetical protein
MTEAVKKSINGGVAGRLSTLLAMIHLIQFDEVFSLLKVSQYLRKEWLEPPGKSGI